MNSGVLAQNTAGFGMSDAVASIMTGTNLSIYTLIDFVRNVEYNQMSFSSF